MVFRALASPRPSRPFLVLVALGLLAWAFAQDAGAGPGPRPGLEGPRRPRSLTPFQEASRP